MERREYNIGRRLRDARKASGLTLQEAAERIGGISYNAICMWENGKSMPSADNLLAACEVYDIDDVVGFFRGDAE